MVKFAPMGDPIEVRIHGYELTLRLADAETDRDQHNMQRHDKRSRPAAAATHARLSTPVSARAASTTCKTGEPPAARMERS